VSAAFWILVGYDVVRIGNPELSPVSIPPPMLYSHILFIFHSLAVSFSLRFVIPLFYVYLFTSAIYRCLCCVCFYHIPSHRIELLQVTYDKSGLLRCPHCIEPCTYRVRKSNKNFLLDGLTAVRISHLQVSHIWRKTWRWALVNN
jgi:hypothetical protein